jgi:hypothetical protein
MTGYTESRKQDGRKNLSGNSASEYDQTPNVTVSGKREFMALNIDRALPSLSRSPLKVSENREK